MSGLLLLVPLDLCLPVIKLTHYCNSFSFNPKGVPLSVVWWFHRDSNPNVFSSVAKCFIQLNYETSVVQPGLEPGRIESKSTMLTITLSNNLSGSDRTRTYEL